MKMDKKMNIWIRIIGLLHLPLGFLILHIAFNIIDDPFFSVWLTVIFGGYSFLVGIAVLFDTLGMFDYDKKPCS